MILLAPIALLNTLCFINSEWKFSILFAIVWSVCAFVMYLKFVPDSAFKATSAVFLVLLTVAVIGFYIWNLIYGSFVNKLAVESSYPSTDGTYIAEVCSSESLLDKKMAVYIAKSDPEFKAVIGYYQAKPAKIYEGESHEIKTAYLSWLDDVTLVINDEAYRSVN